MNIKTQAINKDSETSGVPESAGSKDGLPPWCTAFPWVVLALIPACLGWCVTEWGTVSCSVLNEDDIRLGSEDQ